MRIKQNNKTVCYICPPYNIETILDGITCIELDKEAEITMDDLDEKYAEWANHDNCLGLSIKSDLVKRFNFSFFCNLEELISYELLLELQEWYYDESQDYEEDEV